MKKVKENKFRSRGFKKHPGRKKSQSTNFDIREAIERLTSTPDPEKDNVNRHFRTLDLAPAIQQNLSRLGYSQMTAIQDQTFDYLVDGRDVLGIANTGTGKTVAYLLPIIQRLMMKEFQSLILVPTRELAQQVQQEFCKLTKDMGLYSTCLIGGTNINKDISSIRKRNHIIIGTPGRIIDLMERKVLSFKKTETLVLDEFDRMLDMGFIRDVRKIAESLPTKKQTLLFSATEELGQKHDIATFLHNPFRVCIHSGQSIGKNIRQQLVKVEADEKIERLIELLSVDHAKKVLVFAETRRQVDKLERKLRNADIKAVFIHGDRSQSQRNRALEHFRDERAQVLVATDVAARGLDVSDVSHVINFQVPRTLDSYIHRIGRTGRAGKQGEAITFID